MRKSNYDCRYCSVVSKANREDPIGTAGTVDEWLLVEVPQPWKTHLWEEKPQFKPLLQVVEKLASQSIRYTKTRLLAIAPNQTHTHPELIRVFHYKRPAKLFNQYTKQEYLLPLSQLAPLAEALLFKQQKLINFQPYHQPTEHIREILICTHTNYDRACGRFGYPLYQQLQKQYTTKNLRVWQTNHFGGHQFAPTLIDFPNGQVWGHLELDVLDCLIYREGDVSQLRPFYRGWTGLSKFEQIAEREIWMRTGWEWLNYCKTGRILAQDEGGIKKKLLKIIFKYLPFPKLKLLVERWNEQASWVKLEIRYTSEDEKNWGAYSAIVKQTGTVTTKLKSGDNVPLVSVNQYGVEELRN